MHSEKPLRLLVFCGGSYVAGAEIVTLNLLREIKSRGYEIKVIASGWNDGDFIGRLQHIGIEYTDVKLGFIYLTRWDWTKGTLVNYPAAYRSCRRIIKNFKPDIIYHVSNRDYLMLLPLILHENNVYTEHNVPDVQGINKVLYWLTEKTSRYLVGCSHFVGRNLERISACPEKVRVIHNGIDVTSGPSVMKSRSDDVYIGMVAQIIPRKNHLLLIRSLHRLQERFSRFKCLLFGSTETGYFDVIQQEIERLDLGNKIQFMHFVHDRDDLYSRIDIAVIPSKDEPFGLAAIEPGLYGIPVIGARSGGLQEVIQHGETGYLFDLDNAAELDHYLYELCVSESKRKQLGDNGRKFVRDRFSVERMAHEYDVLFRKSCVSHAE